MLRLSSELMNDHPLIWFSVIIPAGVIVTMKLGT